MHVEDETLINVDTERQEIIKRVRRFGGSASDAVLDPGCSIFTLPNIDGMIAYRYAHSCAVVYGDPLCAKEDLEQLVCAFHQVCDEKGLNVVYVTSTEHFSRWALKRICKAMIEFGEELHLDPNNNPKDQTGVKGSLVRRKVRHALKDGCIVNEYIPSDLKLEEAIEKVGISWLQARQGPQIHTSNIHLFENRSGKRWFYVSHQGSVVGVIVLNQLQACNGWLVNHLMYSPEAPNGTPELLLTHALEVVAKEDCHYVTFGSVPSASLGEIKGLNPFARFMARAFFWIAHKIFHLGGKLTFWGKFHPRSKPSYLVFSSSSIGCKELRALMAALNVSF